MKHPETCQFTGEAGLIDAAIDWPEGSPCGWALALHPHPLYQGSRSNKVITTMARALTQSGYVVVRPDFRGVGKSAGTFDSGHGETLDMVALVKQFKEAFPDLAALPWQLCGFSFGTAVAVQLYNELEDRGERLPEQLFLAGPAVWRFAWREITLPASTCILHGSQDEVVPLQEALDWLEPYRMPMAVLPGASHFFHGRLIELKTWVLSALQR